MRFVNARFLLTCLTGVSVLLTANATPGDGICDPNEAAAGLCFVSSDGFVVEAVTGPGGEFPVIDLNGNSVFSYLITGPGVGGGSCSGVTAVSHASMLVPNTCVVGGITVLDASPASRLLTGGGGDPSCGFGIGDLQNDVLKWDDGVACNETKLFTMVIAGAVSAAPQPLALKAGPNCSVDTILGPGCPYVVKYCPSNTNTTGQNGEIEFHGSFSIAANDFSLIGTGLPSNQPGFFFYGTAQIDLPFGNGKRCIGGNVKRLRKIAIPVTGESATQFDFTVPPLNSVVPGVPYYFQLYYRDPMGGGLGFNTTDALAILFTP